MSLMSMALPHDRKPTDVERRYMEERNLVDQLARLDALPDAEESEEDAEDYTSWKKDDLIAECKRRELPHSGTVDELRARLVEDDEAEEDDDE